MAKNHKEDEIITKALDRFRALQAAQEEMRRDMVDDLQFRNGKQWDEKAASDRYRAGRPCLVLNKIPTYVNKCVNELRMNRPQMQVRPVDSGADKDTAEVINGILTHIVYNSKAESAYDTAADFAISCGIGWIRVRTDYEGPDSFDQEIHVDRMPNVFQIYAPLHDCNEADYSDMKYAFVIKEMLREEFEDKYPEQDTTPWDGAKQTQYPGWFGEDRVRIAEYYNIETESATLYQLSDNSVVTDVPPVESGLTVVRKRQVDIPTVVWRLMSGSAILDEKPVLGSHIPLIPVVGQELNIEGKKHYISLTRFIKDPQRMYNYWRPISLDTPIVTINGWKTMGELTKDDKVYDANGQPCKVVGMSPVYKGRPCNVVAFNNGTDIVADDDHEWTVVEKSKRKSSGYEWTTKTLQTKKLIPGTHFIRVVQPLQGSDVQLPINPYALGMWLGNGTTDEPSISHSVEDMAEVVQYLGYPVGNVHKSKGTTAITRTILGVRKLFTAAGLLGNKHIPAKYLRASYEQRLALLQGLMDSDGTITPAGQCGFSNTNKSIIEGMKELLRTFGIQATCLTRDRVGEEHDGIRHTLIDYQFSFTTRLPVFKLTRKADRLGKRAEQNKRTTLLKIVSVTPTASVPVRCIEIDSPSHLYLAGVGMVPTHNSCETEMIALAPKTPFIGVEGQFAGRENQWKMLNTHNMAYIEYKDVNLSGGQSAPPPRRADQVQIPAGYVNAAVEASRDIMDIANIHESSLGKQGNETSGRAISARQSQSEISNFHYLDNLTVALRQVARICVDWIPDVYDTPRVIHIVGEDKREQVVTVNKEYQNDKGETKLYNLSAGKYDVTCDVGQSYASKRAETVDQLNKFVQVFPPAAQVAGDLIIENMDFPGAQQLADRLKRLIPPNLLDDKPQQGIPPEAIKQLTDENQQLTQVAKQMDDTIQKLTFEIENKDKDRELEIDKALLSAETALAVAQSKVVPPDPNMLNVMMNEILEMKQMLLPSSQNTPVQASGPEQMMAQPATAPATVAEGQGDQSWPTNSPSQSSSQPTQPPQ